MEKINRETTSTESYPHRVEIPIDNNGSTYNGYITSNTQSNIYGEKPTDASQKKFDQSYVSEYARINEIVGKYPLTTAKPTTLNVRDKETPSTLERILQKLRICNDLLGLQIESLRDVSFKFSENKIETPKATDPEKFGVNNGILSKILDELNRYTLLIRVNEEYLKEINKHI